MQTTNTSSKQTATTSPSAGYTNKYAYAEGHYAFYRGWLECKYNPESTKGKEWQRGFDAAYFENLDEYHRRRNNNTGPSYKG